MSMSVVLAELEKTANNKLSANYKEHSTEVIVTDFINELLTSSISEFEAYEDDEKIIYKEINNKNFDNLTIKIKEAILASLENIALPSGKEQKELQSHLYDLISLNDVFFNFYKKCYLNPAKNLKVLVV